MPKNDNSTDSDGPTSSNAFGLDNFTQIDEPSPLDRILSDGRDYNAGNWSSEELKRLFDGVHKYGTGSSALNYIARNVMSGRSEAEIDAKIDEIREIIKEHKEHILPDFYRKRWIETGHRNIGPPLESDVDPDESWTSIIAKVKHSHHKTINKLSCPIQEALERVFTTFEKEARVQRDVPVTSLKTARAEIETKQNVRWPVIYTFMRACTRLDEQMPALNELEAAIVANVLDTIENEASAISDKEKAVMAGVFTECQLGDFRFCEQDSPADARSCMQLLVDPLRTRAHGVPEVAAEVEIPEDNKPSTSST